MQMPLLFLSPSTQEFNPYVTTGNEEYWMNQLADRMEPYLLASGIGFERNYPNLNAAAAIRQSNNGNFDFHLALHSNASGPGREGGTRGIDIYYYPGSADSLRMAEILVDNLKPVYPLPELVRALPTMAIGEVRRTKAPAVLAELGYHDNPDDATWVKNNLDRIAQNIVLSLTEYFGIPFLSPQRPRQGLVDVSWGYLNIRSRPTVSAPVIAKAYDGARLTILNQFQNWYLVTFDGTEGYASSDFITLV